MSRQFKETVFGGNVSKNLLGLSFLPSCLILKAFLQICRPYLIITRPILRYVAVLSQKWGDADNHKANPPRAYADRRREMFIFPRIILSTVATFEGPF